MSIKDLAADFIDLCRLLKFAEAGEKYWSDDVVSIEAGGPTPDAHGKAAVAGKVQWFAGAHEIHSFTAEGPYLNGDQFTVRFQIDMSVKANGQRHQMDEIALYTVKDGAIVEERYFYGGAMG